ncbi:hypothetical protein BASA83_001734 [Batrachochytrium salamandrivorans]|nr:hypothetical protein BASA83_001734 [Batrachochytrium salamandrivorans]
MGFMPFGFLDKAYESVRNAALGLMPGTATTNTNGSRLPTQPLSSSLTTVLIFVAPDVDSICCLKMLVALLKSDCILYRIVPVSGYTGLGDANDTLIIGNTALKSIIMINAGGMVDLAEFLTLEEGVTVYVLDAHRPLNLQNIFGSSQIMVLDDGDISDMKDLRKAFEELEFDGYTLAMTIVIQLCRLPMTQHLNTRVIKHCSNRMTAAMTMEMTIKEIELMIQLISIVVKINPITTNHDEGDGRIEIQDSTSVSTTLARDRSRKRKSDTMIAALSLGPSKRVRQHEKRRLRREYQRQIAEYYAGGTYHGMAASGLMYTITSQLGRSNRYGIIGLTDYYIHNKVSLVKYVELIKSFQEEVNLVSIREGKSGGASMAGGIAGGDASSSLQDVFGIEYDDDDLFGERPLENNATSLAMTSTMGSGRSADDYSINYHEDFRLMLLKHWTMYDSMFHSEYVATKLGMWRSKGRQRLTNLLVKMGFPQKESRQNYVEMSLPFKKRIKPKLQDLAPRFNMPDLLFPSFYRNFGHSVPLSATDVVYALSALVDCGATTLATDAGCSSASGYEARLGVSVSLSADQTRRKYGSGTRVGDTGDIMSGQGQGDSGDMGDQGLIGGGMGTRSNAGSIALRVLADSEYAGDGGDDQPGWMRNFYTAYDALDSVHWLHHGILLAIHIQRILVRTGMMLLDKKSVQTLQKFQMVSLMSLAGDGVSNSGSNGIGAVSDITVFGSSVMVLHRLMGFLMDAFAEHRKSSKRLPFVLVACLDKDASHCLVIGRSETQHVGVKPTKTLLVWHFKVLLSVLVWS